MLITLKEENLKMNKVKRIAAVALSAALLAACGGAPAENSGENTGGETVSIGIVQYAEHPALDDATAGFEDYLESQGYSKDGFDYKNAQGDQSNCVTIAQTFVNGKKDLIYAVATPAAQVVANETSDIPIIISAVTDPASSGLVESNEKPGTNVTGSSDLTPVEAQLELLKEILPETSKIAIMYCNAEENSKFQADLAKKTCDELGLAYQEATVTDSNQIQQVVESLIGKVDAIYVPTDNLLAEGMATLTQVANENGIPTMVGEEGMVENGALITKGLNYYELGQLAGKQAVAILKDGKNAADLAVEYIPSDKCKIVINKETMDKLGITIPDEVVEQAELVGAE